MKKRLFIFLVVSLLIFGNVSASFDVGNVSHQITKSYPFGSFLKGWINITLTNEPVSSLFESSFGTKKTLMEILDLNDIRPGEGLNCIPTDCNADYATVGDGADSVSFNLNAGESATFGLRFVGDEYGGITYDNNGVDSDFSITVNSDAEETTKPQLLIDLVSLDDNRFEWGSYVHSGNYYNEDQGCYESGDTIIPIRDDTPFCSKIILPATPNVNLGAFIIRDESFGDGIASFVFDIFEGSLPLGSCLVNVNIDNLNPEGKISCVADVKTLELKEVFVCLQTSDSGYNNEYKINSEKTNPCGYAGDPGSSRDFNIFTQSGKYARLDTFGLNDTELESAESFVTDIGLEIDNYIAIKYNNVCTNECVVPIRFTSGIENQKIDLTNIEVSYLIDNVRLSPSLVYNITNTPAVASLSDYFQLQLDDLNFSLPNSFGNHTFKLFLGGNSEDKKIFSETILIEKTPQIKSLKPLFIVAASPTTFWVEVDKFGLNTSIIKYEWDFGNGDKRTSTENSTVYTYPEVGAFKINVTIIDSNLAKSSASFDRNVRAPKDAVNDLLKRRVEDLGNIKGIIEDLPSFQQTSLNSALDIAKVEPLLADIQQRNASTDNTDADYIEMMNLLIGMRIPSSINITEKADDFPFYTDQSKIKLNILSQIGDDEYTEAKSALYLDAILSWSINNVQTTIDFKEFSGTFEEGVEEIASIFEVNINENQNRNSSFFIIPKFEKMVFQKDYGEKEISGYYYIEIVGDAKNIAFSTTEKLNIIELPAFISPRIGRFSAAIEFTKEEREKLSRQTILVLSLILVVFLGLLVYLAMQVWYKRKYERYLFKSKNDLYNLVSYIQSAKKRGIEINEMQSKLRKIGWNSEQIKYIMRKYAGKRTGMVELIPFSKIFSMFKRKKNLPIRRNPRFISTRKI